MPSVQAVADYLLRCGVDADTPEQSDLLSPLRLQKLLYYAQGYALAVTGRPLFEEPVRAWRCGPVVESVYRAYERLGAHGIDPTPPPSAEPLTPRERDIAWMAWAEYGQYSAHRLAAMTRAEPAWVEARGALPAGEKSDAKLSPDTMACFFREKLRDMVRGKGLPDPIADWQADEDFEAGRVVPLSALRVRARV